MAISNRAMAMVPTCPNRWSQPLRRMVPTVASGVRRRDEDHRLGIGRAAEVVKRRTEVGEARIGRIGRWFKANINRVCTRKITCFSLWNQLLRPMVLWETVVLGEVGLERSKKACEQGTGAPGKFQVKASVISVSYQFARHATCDSNCPRQFGN